ncbi:hypothetical protein SAMN03159358_4533 [Paenibacillus sp. NFR01]|nr:hypothetical protein SAMN03159358_4533 [Paenibacillus sp. NFR01]
MSVFAPKPLITTFYGLVMKWYIIEKREQNANTSIIAYVAQNFRIHFYYPIRRGQPE